MILAYRVADRRHPLFDGGGAALRGARWNSVGRRVIYACDTLAGAMLEVLAHLPSTKLPRHHAYIRIEIPAAVSCLTADLTELPDWSAPESPAARRYGDRWLDERRACVLRVPSVIVPEGYNLLINPLHPEFERLRASEPLDLHWDARLFGSGVKAGVRQDHGHRNDR